MASTINAISTGAGGIATTADASGILSLQTGGVTAVTVDASQNVGIGTASPSTYSTKLGVKTAADQDSLAYFGGSSYATRIGVNSSFAVIEGVDASTGTSSYQPFCVRGSLLYFNTGGTERMRIDSSGKAYWNTTSVIDNTLYNFNFTSANNGIGVKTDTTATSYHFRFQNPNGTIGGIYTNTSTTTYTTSSDYRLKENIMPMAGALDKVLQLNPVTYNWKVDGSYGQGFIAHELQAIVPECVGGEKDAVDADGKPIYQGVDTSFLVATLTAAIQEQQTIINDLKARVTALEAK